MPLLSIVGAFGGAIIGYALAGDTGAILGAIIGLLIGVSLDAQSDK